MLFDLPDGLHMERFDDVLYDTVDLPSGVEAKRLFWGVLGSPGKTDVDTNSFLCSMLPIPHQFHIRQFFCAFFSQDGLIPVDHPIYWRSCVTFQVGDNVKPYWHSPCWAIAHPAAILARIEHLHPDELRLLKDRLAIGKLSEPVELNSTRKFSALIRLMGNFPRVKFVFLAEGTRDRSLM
jgi:hypothetical protein